MNENLQKQINTHNEIYKNIPKIKNLFADGKLICVTKSKKILIRKLFDVFMYVEKGKLYMNIEYIDMFGKYQRLYHILMDYDFIVKHYNIKR